MGTVGVQWWVSVLELLLLLADAETPRLRREGGKRLLAAG
jgi:hypothetical protein